MLPRDMSVRGSLRTMSIEDVLDWVDRRLSSGTLTVEGRWGVRAFSLDAGYVNNVVPSTPSEQPEQVLMRVGLIDEITAELARGRRADSNAPLTELLQDIADLDQTYLSAVLEQHVSESLLDTWAWDDGEFTFAPADEQPMSPGGLGVSVRLRECIVKGRQRAHRWRQIRDLIPSLDVDLSIADRMRLAAANDSEDVLEEILELTRGIDNGWSIGRLIEQWHGWRFRVFDRVALLVERGGLVVSARRAPDQATFADAAEMVSAARAHAEAGRAGKALELVERALRLEPDDASLQNFQRDLERTVFAELSRDLLTSFRVPKLMVQRQELDRLELSDTERYLAGRVDGRWDLLSLMRVAPVREVEALITFKRLADRGIISL